MSSGSTTLILKIQNLDNEEIRRVPLQTEFESFDGLVKHMQSMFGLENTTVPKVTYLDSDGDAISICSTSEFKTAMDTAKDNVLRLYLSTAAKKPDTSPKEKTEQEAAMDEVETLLNNIGIDGGLFRLAVSSDVELDSNTRENAAKQLAEEFENNQLAKEMLPELVSSPKVLECLMKALPIGDLLSGVGAPPQVQNLVSSINPEMMASLLGQAMNNQPSGAAGFNMNSIDLSQIGSMLEAFAQHTNNTNNPQSPL
mmetsp:Transcript_20314/g.30199  ORF Transcript_20314/g.30199 Transcript_20314/m.30199 type:complete len:255 (-) Transcript_20314:33-797(-)